MLVPKHGNRLAGAGGRNGPQQESRVNGAGSKEHWTGPVCIGLQVLGAVSIEGHSVKEALRRRAGSPMSCPSVMRRRNSIFQLEQLGTYLCRGNLKRPAHTHVHQAELAVLLLQVNRPQNLAVRADVKASIRLEGERAGTDLDGNMLFRAGSCTAKATFYAQELIEMSLCSGVMRGAEV